MGTEIEKKDEWLTKEEKAIIRKNFFPPSATDADMVFCMNVAKTFKLNPILKQIYFIERRSKIDNQWVTRIEPLAGRDSFLTLAHRTGRFDGIKSRTEIKDVPYLNNTNEWENKKELVAISEVYVKGSSHIVEVEVPYSEYVQRTTQGAVTKFWKEKPHTMLKKVAESQALRKAFDITGLYDESELNTSRDKEKTIIESNIKPELPFAKKGEEETKVPDAVTSEIVIEEEDLEEMKESLAEEN